MLLWLVACSHDDRGRAVKPACTMACESICAEFRVTFFGDIYEFIRTNSFVSVREENRNTSGFFKEVLMGLQTCKYFTMEKYGAPQMFICLQEQCMV